MSGITSFVRFPGQFDSDLRQLVGSFLEISLSKSTFVPFNIDSTYGYHLSINRMIGKAAFRNIRLNYNFNLLIFHLL